ncbi:uncharacterized protein LOC7463370 isoform X3 [Populus trichocarpa]|uniref:uncharacterized protein LOC7463370 isoform X3 n=1 Tax=Populus trichocarpa TaxID=3694 RepID=UPI00221817D5|nr:uncharacterized protein LOC7463370 isoform X3 [Populus trichocarpa]KAI5565922.1 hypothetical protein BDE02_14G151300 [Populus trichocarpa]
MSNSTFSDSKADLGNCMHAVINEDTSMNAALINKMRKRMAGMNKHIAKYKNTNTSLVKEIVYLRNRQASMTKSHKRQKRTLVHLKDKYNELTDKTTGLSTLLMESYAQLQERNTELEASNAQLRERNVVLENESDARDEVNKENEHELDQAII